MVAPKDRLKKLEQVATFATPQVVVIRRVLSRKDGIIYVQSELNRNTNEYIQFDLPNKKTGGFTMAEDKS
ncbi:MAG TPA: hypothetical protein VHT73_13530 [Thermodesulfobacteriota bacterium]|nr:hypothetical protein [Thermodesulfobacteriota bacterium]